MNKKELVDKIAEGTGLSKKDSESALAETLKAITDELSNGGKVQLIGFGTFEVRDRKERSGRNPKTGKDIIIPACKAPAFKAGKSLKEKVNQ